jgi:hypothetical protein
MSNNLVEVRDRFSRFLSDNAHLNAATRDIAAAFFQSHRLSLRQDQWDEVTISGLVNMMGGLRSKRLPPTGSDQGILALFGVEPIVVVRVAEESGGAVEKNKSTLSLTLPEAMDYLARHAKERETNTKKIREWRRLIARVRPFMTKEGMTIEEGLIAAVAADVPKKKRGKE